MLTFDDEAAKKLEATHLTSDVVQQRHAVLDLLALHLGERVLDVGPGPGFLSAAMAEQLGSDGLVAGVDASDAMLALTRRRGRTPSAAPMELHKGNAEVIPYPDAAFDVVVATQVLEFVPDVSAALAETHRVLRRAGRLLVLDTDWTSLVWHSRDDVRMARVLETWEEHLPHPTLPRWLHGALTDAAFDLRVCRPLPVVNVGFDPLDSFSACLIDIVATFVVARGMPRAEVEAWAADLRSLGDSYFFSLNRYAFLASKRG